MCFKTLKFVSGIARSGTPLFHVPNYINQQLGKDNHGCYVGETVDISVKHAVLMNKSNITFEVARLGTCVFKKCSENNIHIIFAIRA